LRTVYFIDRDLAKIYRPTPKELVFEGKPGSVKQIPIPPG